MISNRYSSVFVVRVILSCFLSWCLSPYWECYIVCFLLLLSILCEVKYLADICNAAGSRHSILMHYLSIFAQQYSVYTLVLTVARFWTSGCRCFQTTPALALCVCRVWTKHARPWHIFTARKSAINVSTLHLPEVALERQCPWIVSSEFTLFIAHTKSQEQKTVCVIL